MRRFGGKRWEKLWNGWKWPFHINLSLILGEKIWKPAKWPKLAVLRQSKPLFGQNSSLWVSLSCFSVKLFEKVEKLKTFADVPPHQGMKIFEISSKMRRFGGKKMGKVVNWVKLAIPSQCEPHFGRKDGKACKLTKIGCFEHIKATFFGKIGHCGSL